MIKQRLSIIGGLLLCIGALAQSMGHAAPSEDHSGQLLAERRHFLECLAAVYNPAFWVSYNGSLYFQATTEAQMQQLETMKAARAKYIALTNRSAWHEIAAQGIAASGIEQRWQAKLLLPFSATNRNLTPILGKAVRVIPAYKVLRHLASGDALIQDAQGTYFVMGFGRGADDAAGTNACLIRVGGKSYAEGGVFRTVEAFENVSLSAEERSMLNRVTAAFQRQSAPPAEVTATPKARQEFEDCVARATDSNPYMEYLLARCYLEGKGTVKNEKVGMEWMHKAAKSGSGDATAFLEQLGHKAP
jgi:hypothetical protein